MNWARGLGGFRPRGDDLRLDAAFDAVTARSLLQRAGLARHSATLAPKLMEAAWSLAGVAAAHAPELRSSWGANLAQTLTAGLDGNPQYCRRCGNEHDDDDEAQEPLEAGVTCPCGDVHDAAEANQNDKGDETMSDGMTDAARDQEDAEILHTASQIVFDDAASWESKLRERLGDSPGCAIFLVPRAYIEQMLKDHEGLRDVARLLVGSEEWTGG